MSQADGSTTTGQIAGPDPATNGTSVVSAADLEPTIGKLVYDVSKDMSALLRAEIELIKSEVKVSATAGGIGLALLAVAGFLAVVAFIILTIAFAYFITFTGLHPAWAFLIVFGVYMLIVGILVAVAIGRFKRVRPPERGIEQLKRNKEIRSKG